LANPRLSQRLILCSPYLGQQVIFWPTGSFLNGNFDFIQSKVTNRSESVIALNYLIELVYRDWPSV